MSQPDQTMMPYSLSRRTLLAGSAALVAHALMPRLRAWGQSTEHIPNLLKKHKVPGLLLSHISKGGMNLMMQYGVRSLTGNAPMTDDTVMEAASLSKPMFACAVMRLRDRGVLDLDAPLTQYVDEPFVRDEPRLQAITARMTLSHQSGLPHGREEGAPLKLVSDPGTRFLYSATGFDYLQHVVQRLIGKTLAETMRAEVLGPLGMSNSSFGWDAAVAAPRADAYDAKGNPGITFNERYRTQTDEWRAKVKELFPELSYPSAAAGSYTTIGDYTRFLMALLNPGRDPEWLAADTIREMFRREIAVDDGVAWGLGWGLMESDRGRAFWHWGNWSGLFQHFAAGVPDRQNGITLLTNSGNGLKLCQELVPDLMGFSLKPIRGFLN